MQPIKHKKAKRMSKKAKDILKCNHFKAIKKLEDKHSLIVSAKVHRKVKLHCVKKGVRMRDFVEKVLIKATYKAKPKGGSGSWNS